MKSNQEKLILLAAVVVFALLAFFAYRNINKEVDGINSISGKSAVFETSPAEIAQAAKSKFSEESKWFSPRIYEDEIKLNLFTARPILVPIDNPDTTNPIELDNPESRPLHPGVPNRWFLEHGIKINAANALELDADKDGFTNGEEFASNTNPIDPKSRPDETVKLALKKLNSSAMAWDYNAYANGIAILNAGQMKEGVFQREWSDTITGVGERFGPRDKPERYEMLELNPKDLLIRDHSKEADARNATFRINLGKAEEIKDYSAVFLFTLLSPKGKQVVVNEQDEFTLPDLPDMKFRLAKIDVESNSALVEEIDENGKVLRTLKIGQNGPE